MKQIVLDFETYYDADYSLRKMTPVQYILDPRFEVIGVAVKEDGGKSFWLTHQELIVYLSKLPKRVTILSHNALFDMCILSWIYNYVPTIMIDTLGMARAWIGHKLRSLSLDNVAKHLGIGVKGDTIYKVQGMSLAAIKAAGFYEDYAAYSCNDADLCWDIYRKFIEQGFPVEEIAIMDTVLRCAVQPVFVLDQQMLHEHLNYTIARKADLLARAGLTDRESLMSNDRFAEALRNFGVEPPTKISLTTGKETYAFAKTDQAFMELEEDENPDVQALVSARLGIKSTIEETRTQRLISISQLTWPGIQRPGTIPMALRYSGAHTHRLCLSGNTGINVLRDNRVVYTTLDDLRGHDLVWDGEVFVKHGGLSFAGIKKVMTYDEITGTPDHRVWTLEHGYCKLAEAKASGYNIARGAVPDAARIDPSVQWAHSIQDGDQVHLRQVFSGNGFDVEGLAPSQKNLVPILPQEGTDGWGSTFAGNAGCSRQGKYRLNSSTAYIMDAGSPDTFGGTINESPGKGSLASVAGEGLEDRDVSSGLRSSALHESSRVKLPVLRGARNQVSVCFDSLYGRLATGEPRPQAGGPFDRPDRLQRALHPGESPLGDKDGAVPQQVFMPVWDIVDCGPRNRFMANGRIVHNSGDWKLNMQNLPRGGTIRKAIQAPETMRVVACDSSQIEARIAAWFCGADTMTNAFANKEDVYSTFASKVFGYEVHKKTHPVERFVGKTAVLGLQYGLGWQKFQKTVATQSKAQIGKEVVLTDEEASRVINTYRTTYHQIPKMWSRLSTLITRMTAKYTKEDVGPVTFEHERIRLPSGLFLNYHDLQNKDGQWWFTYGGKPKYIYGGKMLENIVQALARICVMDAAVRIRKRTGERLQLQIHDELVYIVGESYVDELVPIVYEEMCRRPLWGMDIPLEAEYAVGQSYGDAK